MLVLQIIMLTLSFLLGYFLNRRQKLLAVPVVVPPTLAATPVVPPEYFCGSDIPEWFWTYLEESYNQNVRGDGWCLVHAIMVAYLVNFPYMYKFTYNYIIHSYLQLKPVNMIEGDEVIKKLVTLLGVSVIVHNTADDSVTVFQGKTQKSVYITTNSFHYRAYIRKGLDTTNAKDYWSAMLEGCEYPELYTLGSE